MVNSFTIPTFDLAPAGTPEATQARNAFIAGVLGVLGDTRLLWLPKTSSTTTVTDETLNARVFTEAVSLAGRMTNLGSAVTADYDGTNDYASVPDAANLSFGDGSVDDAFSIGALFNTDVSATAQAFLAKHDWTTGSPAREYRFTLDASNRLLFELYDESAAALIGRRYSVAEGTGSWVFTVGTYDGSGIVGGVKVFRNASQVDDTNVTSGTYVAMEDTAATVELGRRIAASGASETILNGKLGMLFMCLGALTQHQQWIIKARINSFFGLTL